VSGTHNTIVATRAGKDLISSVASGMLTIGPRFGGAIDGAAQSFSDAFDRGLTPSEFIEEMKKKGENIQGIGHLIKSLNNPDKRVTILKDYAKKHFKATPLLNYALEVEKLTTTKKDNLILNVDGCIGICFVDLMRTEMSKQESDEYVKMGALNGLFVVGRTIGMTAHFLDQKRLKQGLYRHPWDDITYMTE
jgi:ATP citrate (pro-S)-lyase